MSGDRIFIRQDYVSNLMIWDKFVFTDENYFGDTSDILDGYTFYVLNSRRIPNTKDEFMLVLLGVPPGWEGEIGESDTPLIIGFMALDDDRVAIYLNSNYSAWTKEIDSIQLKLARYYIREHGLDMDLPNTTDDITDELEEIILDEAGLALTHKGLAEYSESLMRDFIREYLLKYPPKLNFPMIPGLETPSHTDILKLLEDIKEDIKEDMYRLEEDEDDDEDDDE